MVRVPKELATTFNDTFAGLPRNPAISKGLILNEEGYAKIELLANSSEMLHIFIAHPTAARSMLKCFKAQLELSISRVWLIDLQG